MTEEQFPHSAGSAAEDVVSVTVVVPRARLAELYTTLGKWFGPEKRIGAGGDQGVRPHG